MNEKQIDFLGRWALAFFAVFILLVGWLGNSIRNEQFDKRAFISPSSSPPSAASSPSPPAFP